MKNTSLDMIKKKYPISNQDEWLIFTPDSNHGIDQLDQMAIREAYGKLEQNDKSILNMILLCEYTAQEAAAFLGITIAATYKRYERALRRLKDIYGN